MLRIAFHAMLAQMALAEAEDNHALFSEKPRDVTISAKPKRQARALFLELEDRGTSLTRIRDPAPALEPYGSGLNGCHRQIPCELRRQVDVVISCQPVASPSGFCCVAKWILSSRVRL